MSPSISPLVSSHPALPLFVIMACLNQAQAEFFPFSTYPRCLLQIGDEHKQWFLFFSPFNCPDFWCFVWRVFTYFQQSSLCHMCACTERRGFISLQICQWSYYTIYFFVDLLVVMLHDLFLCRFVSGHITRFNSCNFIFL